MNNTFCPLLLLLLLPLVCGCGQKLPPGMPPLQPCQITITQANKPLEGADIRLHPSETGTQWSVSGTTDSTGVANLVTHGQYPKDKIIKPLTSAKQCVLSKMLPNDER